MSSIFKRIGELLGFKQPKQAAMATMTAMEPMPEPGQMMEMKQMPEMEMQEHQSNKMAATPGEMEMTEMKPEGHRERRE